MKRVLLWAIVIAVWVLAAIQLVHRVDTTNPHSDPRQGVFTQVKTDPHTRAILERSCFDCHSNDTNWPRYSHVAPISWLVGADVKEGRQALNFSDWGTYPDEKQSELLDEICEESAAGDMPEQRYLWIHRSARLSRDDIRAICDWSKAAQRTVNDHESN